MKDIIITGKRIKTELKILLGAYITANLLNVFAIWYYETNWLELLTFQRLIIVISILLYSLTWVGRGLWILWRTIKKRG